ncbi:hypothetical protein pb186bvf_019478 [Paramecium bursaria]
MNFKKFLIFYIIIKKNNMQIIHMQQISNGCPFYLEIYYIY